MKTRISFALGVLTCFFMNAQEVYELGPNSLVQKDVPKGTMVKKVWESTIFPNTIRDYYVYVPAQYDGTSEAALMVFQDGHAYVDLEGDYRVPTVFDNLIAQQKMPITIGLFINPGHDKDAPEAESPWRVTNRSVEYDEVSGTYGDFLLQELIPELKKNYRISEDPKMNAVCGLSSGGICAFSVAWFHTNRFQKVMSHIGSFTDIRGGHNYPPMIRKNEPKDIKVFMQDGSNDLDNQFGNWWLANLQMDSALKFKGYDYKFVPGTGGHDGGHAGSILPESLEWLWSDVAPNQE
ncbi:esterase family protein [Muricauda sp. MAR_2010_75]|jgi:enterochelin esterase-like enzyme|uniref:alpha/beta hydrolase n=1 Tax=Allomuricauda sp. MAR_2010_75 TaxID=1250232 RepID=UPI000A7649D1|nr:alpha/beta hydrolase-fold protein [Muricauda sp. MAR_2010_75]